MREQDGTCRVEPRDKVALTRIERKLLDLCGYVLSNTVHPNGKFPSSEELLAGIVRIGVPIHVIGALFSYPDHMLAELLSVPASLIAMRREMILSTAGPHRVPIEMLGGGNG